MTAVLSLDFETRSRLNLKKVGAQRYAADESTDVLCTAYAVDDGPVMVWTPDDVFVPPEIIEAAINPEWVVSAFNAGFERAIISHVMPRYGWPTIAPDKFRCTMASALSFGLPGSLAKCADALSLDQRKDKDGHKAMLQLTKPRKDGSWETDPTKLQRLYEYCKIDVVTERALFRRVGHLIESEQNIWVLDQTINDRGVRLDRGFVEELIARDVESVELRNKELFDITGGAVGTISQTEKLIAWLAANGCEITDIQKATVSHALRRKGISDACRRVLELRRIGAHSDAAKLKTMLGWAGADDRIRGAFRYHGAAPGRWTSQGVQLHNLRREDDGVVSPGRYALQAAPDHRFIKADLSGIESRVLAWVAGEQTKLAQWKLFDQTGKKEDEPYFVNGIAQGFKPEEARGHGKTSDLAFGFGGAVGAFRKMAPDDPSTDEEIQTKKRKWRDSHPQTVRFWHALEAATLRAVAKPGTVHAVNVKIACKMDGDFLLIKLPTGRKIAYPFPRLEDGKFDNMVVVFKDNAAGRFVDCRHGQGAWFGTFVENVVQGIARDVLAYAMQRLEAAGYPVVLHVHDEIVAEVPNGFGSLDEFIRILTTPPAWAPDLPLAAKGSNGPRFSKSATKPESPKDEIFEPDLDDDPDESDPVESAQPEPPDDLEAILDAAPEPDDPDDTDFADYSSGEERTGQAVEYYDYPDEAGQPYHRKVRAKPKKFWQEKWDGGRWVNGAPKVKHLYRVRELLAAAKSVPVCITEGEKDSNSLAAFGLLAVTNPGGSGKWPKDFTPEQIKHWFKGRDLVYLFEDSDAPGHKHVEIVRRLLRELVGEIRTVAFRDLPPASDVSDWLALGHTKAELLARMAAAPKWEPDAFETFAADELDDMTFAPIKEIIPGFVAEGLTLFAGKPKIGKSWLLMHAAWAVASGGKTLGGIKCEQGDVLYCALEDNKRRLQRRMTKLFGRGPKPPRLHFAREMKRLGDGGLDQIKIWLKRVKAPPARHHRHPQDGAHAHHQEPELL
jgi:DNA polymerase bacteriophage-type